MLSWQAMVASLRKARWGLPLQSLADFGSFPSVLRRSGCSGYPRKVLKKKNVYDGHMGGAEVSLVPEVTGEVDLVEEEQLSLRQTRPPSSEGDALPSPRVAIYHDQLSLCALTQTTLTSFRSSSPAYSPSISSDVSSTAPFLNTSPSSSTSRLELMEVPRENAKNNYT